MKGVKNVMSFSAFLCAGACAHARRRARAYPRRRVVAVLTLHTLHTLHKVNGISDLNPDKTLHLVLHILHEVAA